MSIHNHELATRGERLIARFLDYLIVLFIFIISLTISSALTGISTNISLLGLLIAAIYSLCADGLKDGQSYGKRLVGISVIDATSGQPCTFAQSIARNLILFFLRIFDWAFIFSQKKQRLGDRIANTIVVKKRTRDSSYQYTNPDPGNTTQNTRSTQNTRNTQSSSNASNQPVEPVDCYLEVQVSESQLQRQETIHVKIPVKGTNASFQLKPEMRDKKVRLSGVLEQGADLFVQVRVIADPTPPKPPQPKPSSASQPPKQPDGKSLRHLDVEIAKAFMLYSSIQWNEKASGRATGIPYGEYDSHRAGNKQLRETIPYFSTNKTAFSLLESNAKGFGLYDLFRQILAESGCNETSATLEQKCTAWLKARTEERKRQTQRATPPKQPKPPQSSQSPSQASTPDSTAEEQLLMARLRTILSGDESAIQRLIEYEKSHHPTFSQIELLQAVIERWERDNR